MYHAVAMGVVERIRHFDGELEHRVNGKLAVGVDSVSQGLPCMSGMTKYSVPSASPESYSGRTCGWFSRAAELCFADNTVASKRLCDLITQNLDCDVAAMPDIAREIDGGHPAAAKFAFNLVLARQRSLELVGRQGEAHAWREGFDANIGLEGVVTTCNPRKAAVRVAQRCYPCSRD